MHHFARTLVLILSIHAAHAIAGEWTADKRLINGTPVDLNEWQEVVRIRTSTGGCTATVVGPRVIATAAHCGQTGDTATFQTAGRTHSARLYRHPSYNSSVQYDISIGITQEDIGVRPASIGGDATVGMEITLMGYGCIYSGGGGGNDGILRSGTATVTGFSGTDIVSRGGAALCYGDSGGPAFVFDGNDRLLLGINSKGNIHDTSYNMRTDLDAVTSFLDSMIQQHQVTICGINSAC